ncbi:Z1 domain-containing protein [Massilia sp. Dwa41.01b]|uniref:MZA anti-phage system associated Z1 domain-containing protein MzaC n=1 Tax=unclassified Massilia TaxID=2609279 RepID=UPI0015FF0A41|nr:MULTISPECIES: MZA anti-phage system associated Z1 domain-containing protein MzaC [unclassified Massilia]QNA87465.1 Z1 domain-containing protein [Massilia sp. Dwa41.01b]QNA98371.1 Z1 domain-containing protein [Massilia sp. Se16.2.3]
MTSQVEANKTSVIKIVQELLFNEPDKSAITPALIAEKIALVLMMNQRWGEGLDRDAVSDELIRRFSVWRSQDSWLENNEGHVPWLTPERKKDWRYWQRYREFQEARMAWEAVDGLDKSSDRILGMLEDPQRKGPWDRRGLVVGHVQSGKTGNYTGLICKAADAGYKIIIVLAGMHNNLRTQTQMRLDEGFLGFETNPSAEGMRLIGVGTIDQDPSIRPNYATNRTDKGDFIASNVKNLGVSPEALPWLFVVKKNKTVLARLLRWIQTHVADAVEPETGRKVVTHLPLLIIDDEADHASVDTGAQLFDADGKADEDHQPTAINGLIRRILHAFHRKAYVGYTATPFANIFIHERGTTAEAGPDLFPAAFIHNLGSPSNYVGPARVFGLYNGDERQGSLPLVRTVDDHCSKDGRSGWMPVGHKNTHVPSDADESALPASLREAIDAFILSCAARQVRGQKAQHSSMLVHVTRFNAVQLEVHTRVEQYVRSIDQRLSRRIGHQPVLDRLAELWANDFEPTTAEMAEKVPDAGPFSFSTWGEIAEVLPLVVSEISVRVINGTAGDVLDYTETADGLKVIAIGGDKLARGLTLEGLCTSYFLRASRMYDTLMQMGRWFGYRPGYLDLCRLYTTSDLIEWFEHIADASEELRDEFDMMVESGGTPRDYGLKVVSHPVLMVTSRLKMRSARSLYLSFSGHVIETVALHRQQRQLDTNFAAFNELVAAMGEGKRDPVQQRPATDDRWSGVLWEAVSHEHVTDFLSAYSTHPEAMKANSLLLRDFIVKMVKENELTEWTVAVIGGGKPDNPVNVAGVSVQRAKRSAKSHTVDRQSIGRLLSPKDEGIDFGIEAWEAALAETRKIWKEDSARLKNQAEPDVPSGPILRRVRGHGAPGVQAHPERGVLLVYLVDVEGIQGEPATGETPVVAFGVSFPGSRSGTKVEYKVNNVLWELEYGAAD